MRIIYHSTAGPVLSARFAKLARDGLFISSCSETEWSRFHDLLVDAEVIWHLLEPLTPTVIEAAPRLRLIQKIGVGVNTIALDVARRRQVAVCNMPGTNSRAVAEMTLLLILSALRRLTQIDRATRAGQGWALSLATRDQCTELGGKTVGLVGYGAVPRLLAPMLEAMGARVIFTTRSQAPEGTIGEARLLDELLSESDIVSLHVPLTDDTERLINADAISRMKTGAVLVNTARGLLVDEQALRVALEEGRLGAAGLDVFEDEPTSVNNPLFTLENVVVTPHIGYLTRETMERSLVVAAENCRRLASNADLLHRVV